jgi:hypothetical protein|tara:strand:- start:13061 stop:13756 length:696 start_codon:yes stop_codon:yes gene_type:complete
MATSGTTTFNLDLGDIMEEAYERCGLELRSGFDYRTARRSLNLLMLDWQNRGLNLWTVKNASETLVAGTGSYPLTSDKLDVIEGVLRTDAGDITKQTDLTMQRISVSQYSHQTNKLLQGRPIQYYIERSPSGITVVVWPVPDAAQVYTFNYYYMERIEDVGSPATLNMDVPARFLPCLTAGLAYNIAMKRQEAAPRLPFLKENYEEQWNMAADSAREKAALYVVPGGYQYL